MIATTPRALGQISLGLGNNIIHHLEFDKTAKEVCDKLENLFMNKINNSKAFLKQKYYTLKLKERYSLQEHLNTIGSLQLTAMQML